MVCLLGYGVFEDFINFYRITPVIYGYVSQKEMTFEPDTSAYFTLISRRSVCRAGVRYLRRGADKNGDVANFVETEYIIHVFGHCLSYVQVYCQRLEFGRIGWCLASTWCPRFLYL